ncbi:MAG: T9SS type A sorting domain-containing protein, partial [candidate division WOR-3 bacterium]|nr:T9SS type A sorting domain-containing protein [candidate division WOR-3 bacterium]
SYQISTNPFTSSITLNFNSNYLKDLDRIKIYSAAGKVIKNFLPKPVIRWDGKDNKGNEVPAGVYFVSFEKSGNRHSEKILRLGH